MIQTTKSFRFKVFREEIWGQSEEKVVATISKEEEVEIVDWLAIGAQITHW